MASGRRTSVNRLVGLDQKWPLQTAPPLRSGPTNRRAQSVPPVQTNGSSEAIPPRIPSRVRGSVPGPRRVPWDTNRPLDKAFAPTFGTTRLILWRPRGSSTEFLATPRRRRGETIGDVSHGRTRSFSSLTFTTPTRHVHRVSPDFMNPTEPDHRVRANLTSRRWLG